MVYGAQKNHADLFYGVGTHTGNGTPREDIILWQYSDALTGTNDWTPISMEFTVNYYVNSIILEMNGGGQCWFDNMVIEDLSEITADSYYIYDDFDKFLVQIDDSVAFGAHELIDGYKIPLDKGSFDLSCPGMTVDYDNGTVTFGNSGENIVSLSNGKGVCTAAILVNDADESVYVKGGLKFESDFSIADALSTYYASNGVAYTIGTDNQGQAVLRTAGSNTADTLLFGPTLSDYAVEIEFNPTRLTGSSVNTIGIGLRTKSSSDHSSYRVVLAERWRFCGRCCYIYHIC